MPFMKKFQSALVATVLAMSAAIGAMPADRSNPFIWLNDTEVDCFALSFCMALANNGQLNLIGIGLEPNPYLRGSENFQIAVNAARNSGWKNIPDAAWDLGGAYMTALSRPGSGNIDDTAPIDTWPARMVLDRVLAVGTPSKPVVIGSGGALTTAASAYLLALRSGRGGEFVSKCYLYAGIGLQGRWILDEYNAAQDEWALYICLNRMRSYFIQYDFINNSMEPNFMWWYVDTLPNTPIGNHMRYIKTQFPAGYPKGPIGDVQPILALMFPSQGQYYTNFQPVSFSSWGAAPAGYTHGVDSLNWNAYRASVVVGANNSSQSALVWGYNQSVPQSFCKTEFDKALFGTVPTPTPTPTPTPAPTPTPGNQTPYNGSPKAVPGTIATAQYDNGGEGVAFHDTDGTNQMSGTYRPGLGVDSNGSGVGWIYASEWLEYTVNVSAAGSYTISIPVSQTSAGGTMHVSFNGTNVTGSLSIPNTGNWEVQQNVTKAVSLNAGTQILQIVFDGPGANGFGPGLGNISITGSSPTPTPTPTPTPGNQTPYNGSPKAIPGTIATAQYDNGGEGAAFHDTDSVNQQSSTYRPGLGVDTPGSGIGWIYAGEWLEYTVNVGSSGGYTINIPVSQTSAGGTMHVSFNGVNVTGSLSIPSTGSWGVTQTISTSVSLSAGTQVMQVMFDAPGANGFGPGLGDIAIFGGGTTPPPTGLAIPGSIAASNYDNGGEGVAFHDTDSVNQMSSTFRPGLGVDANAGQGIGWIYAGEWVNYTVNVANAGNYVMSLGVCSPGSGGTLHVEFNGANKTGALAVPNTGNWNTTQTINATVNLSAGKQVMRVRFDTNATSGFTCGLSENMVFTPTGTG